MTFQDEYLFFIRILKQYEKPHSTLYYLKKDTNHDEFLNHLSSLYPHLQVVYSIDSIPNNQFMIVSPNYDLPLISNKLTTKAWLCLVNYPAYLQRQVQHNEEVWVWNKNDHNQFLFKEHGWVLIGNNFLKEHDLNLHATIDSHIIECDELISKDEKHAIL